MTADQAHSALFQERFIEINGEVLRIRRAPSIFSNRPGLIDVRVGRRGDWGTLASDGHRYHSIGTFALESRARLGYGSGVLPEGFPFDAIFSDDFFNVPAAA